MLLTRMQIDILVKLTDADTHYFSRSVERLKRANYAEDCSKLFKMQPYHPVFLFVFSQRRRLFFNTTHFTLIQLHKVTPGSSSIQIQCSSAGAGGVKCFLSRTPPERGLQEKRGRVTQTLPPAQSREGLLQSQVSNVFTFSSLKLHSQRNFTDLFQNCFLGFRYIYK